ncbi:MAG: type II secretion system protein [Bacteroidota bacterium]
MKQKGFTLIELLFCMSLIALLISMGAWVYQNFQAFQHRYLLKIDQTYDLIQLQQRLDQDFRQAEFLELSPNACLILKSKDRSSTIHLCKAEKALIRIKEEQIDSLQFEGSWTPQPDGLILIEAESGIRFHFSLLPKAKVEANLPFPFNRDNDERN